MSGIYIKGRKPPNSCDDCWVSDCPNDEHIDGYRMMDRPTCCPLIPVPDHGRLGDLDELAKRIKDEGRNQAEFFAYRFHPVVLAYGDCYGKCNSAPAIIPADKERGE